MKEDLQKEAVDIAIAAFEKCSVEKDVAENIKKVFDKKYGPTWHCIVVKNFGSSKLGVPISSFNEGRRIVKNKMNKESSGYFIR